MYEIVVGLDGDEQRALAQAQAIADLPGSDEIKAVLVHVFRENPEGASVQQVGGVRSARDRLKEAGVEVELDEASGDPTTELLTIANDRDADAISVAGRKRSPTGKVLFGSVTQGVLLEADRTVIVSGVED